PGEGVASTWSVTTDTRVPGAPGGAAAGSEPAAAESVTAVAPAASGAAAASSPSGDASASSGGGANETSISVSTRGSSAGTTLGFWTASGMGTKSVRAS